MYYKLLSYYHIIIIISFFFYDTKYDEILNKYLILAHDS